MIEGEGRALHPAFGVEISPGEDGALDAARIGAGVASTGLVLVRGVDLDETAQLELAASLGGVVARSDGRAGSLKPNVRYERGADRYSQRWHADQSWATTDAWTMLACIEAGPNPEPTLFVNTTTSYPTLPPELRDRATGRTVIHDVRNSRRVRPEPEDEPRRERIVTRLRRRLPARSRSVQTQGTASMIAPQQASRRGTTHPLVDGVSAPTSPHLRIGDHAWLVSGLDEVDSSALLAELEQAVTAPEHVLALDWQVGDLAVFDNRVMLHRRAGTPPADPGRVLRRVLVVAEG